MYKQYVGISRDHSASMRHLVSSAKKDYNLSIESVKNGANDSGIDTIVSVIECGVGSPATNKFVVVNSSVNSLKSLESYEANGSSTPLFDSVGELIDQLSEVPDAEDPSVSFLVMVITDGQENASRKHTAESIKKKMRDLQNTDRWTFTFRVPYGYKQSLVNLGVPSGNILEWEQTERGFETATTRTWNAVDTYYQGRVRGQTMSSNFYSDLDQVKSKDLKKELEDITKQVSFFNIQRTCQIRDFVESKVGNYRLGKSFYQLNKPEKLQGNKLIAIRDRINGKVYAGDAARKLMNLPVGGEIKLHPGNHANYDVFIQSTSVNRKLLPSTELMYWRNA